MIVYTFKETHIRNKKAKQFCLALKIIVKKVTPSIQSSNLLIKDLKEIGEFLKEHQGLFAA